MSNEYVTATALKKTLSLTSETFADDDIDLNQNPPEPTTIAKLLIHLTELHPTPNQAARWTDHAQREPDRVQACLTAAGSARKPAAYLDDLLKRGEWPNGTAPPDDQAARLTGLVRALETWSASVEAAEYDERGMRDELGVRARRARVELPAAEVARLVAVREADRQMETEA